MDKLPKLDLKDRRILAALDMHARMPLGELAKRVGVSRQVAAYRTDRMKKDGIILGALAIFDSVVVGYNWFRVVLRLGGAGTKQKNEVLDFLSNHQHALWVGEVGGNWDVVVNFVTKDIYEFNNVFEDFLSKYGIFVKAYETLVYVHVRDLPRNYILDNKKEKIEYTEFDHQMKFNPALELDEIDKKIIAVISRDASLSSWQIAAKAGVSDKTVSARIKKMEESKLILGYRLLIHPSAIGYESYMIFLGVNNLQAERENELINFVRSGPNITFLVKHIGRWRIGMEIEVKNRVEFQDYLVQLRDKFGDIISDFETFPIFKDRVFNYFPAGNLD
ncbi:Lrp/AsnC family transcriptional regulator [Candidatus Micrarchaeota archaeon]|nr:Lrp/AsnC family transcriptional regulator [Candidatus Micrarchaeota archaeon]